MKSVTFVDSHFGHTAQLAHELAAGLGHGASVIRLGSAGVSGVLSVVGEADFVIVGGPTIDRGISRRLEARLVAGEAKRARRWGAALREAVGARRAA